MRKEGWRAMGEEKEGRERGTWVSSTAAMNS